MIRIRWYGYVQSRPTDITLRRVDCLEITGDSKEDEDLKNVGYKQLEKTLRYIT